MNRYSGGPNVVDFGAFFAPFAPLLIIAILYDKTVYPISLFEMPTLWALGLLISFALIVVHEGAHWIVGKLFGIEITSVTIGHWRKLFSFTLGGVPVTFRAAPSSGFVTVGGFHSVPAWRLAPFLGAGVCAEIVLVVLVFSQGVNLEDTTTFAGVVHTFVAVNVAWAGIWHAIVNLLPAESKIGGVSLPNDGLQILQLWTERKKRPELRKFEADTWELNDLLQANDLPAALKHAEDLTLRYPDHPRFPIIAGTLHAEAGNLERAEQLWRNLLEGSHSAECFAEVLDMLCCLAIYHGRIDLLPEADMWSSEALRYAPQAITVMGTRGSILMELGKIDEGMTMLRDVEKRTECPVDKTICSAYLAKGHQIKGEVDLAQKWMARAQAINADHVVVKRIAKEMSHAASG